MPTPKLNVGGQAVIEGVMMRSPRCFAVAVRRQDRSIVVREQPWRSTVAARLLKIPFVRGVLVLVESMTNGYSALQFSAQQYEQDLPEDQRGGDSTSTGQRLGLVLAFLIMVALPKLFAWGAGQATGHALRMGDPRFHLLTGFFKLAIVVGLMAWMRRNAEMYRVFQYHGAEHKAIATWEAGEALTVENARRHSTRHARCGTTFLMVVVLVSVAIFALVLPLVLPNSSGFGVMLLSIPISLVLMAPIASVSYELQRLGARYSGHPVARFFLTPGYWVQGITTAPPTDDQVEIALAALRITLQREQAQASTAPAGTVVQTYPSYAALATEYGGL